jgi:hypothetical protein
MTAVKIQLSDPWDVGEAIGWRAFHGMVRSQKPLVVELDTTLLLGDRRINWLLGTARYGGDRPLSSEPLAYNLLGVDQLDADPATVLARYRGPAHGTRMLGTVSLRA